MDLRILKVALIGGSMTAAIIVACDPPTEDEINSTGEALLSCGSGFELTPTPLGRCEYRLASADAVIEIAVFQDGSGDGDPNLAHCAFRCKCGHERTKKVGCSDNGIEKAECGQKFDTLLPFPPNDAIEAYDIPCTQPDEEDADLEAVAKACCDVDGAEPDVICTQMCAGTDVLQYQPRSITTCCEPIAKDEPPEIKLELNPEAELPDGAAGTLVPFPTLRPSAGYREPQFEDTPPSSLPK